MPTLLGNGTSVRAMEAGTWVKTIVLMRPIRRARDEAARLEALLKMLRTKKRVPRKPSARWNLPCSQ